MLIAAMLLVGLHGAAHEFPACRFAYYFQTLERSDVGLWDRLVYSLILAGAPPARASSSQKQIRPAT